MDHDLPDFLIIGTMRGGTSSLFKYLGSHPSVIPSIRKEIWYFSNPKYYSKGERWYRTHFPSQLYKKAVGAIRRSKVVSFEASANYLYDPRAPELAAQLLPGIKLIVMLRNPVDRLYSHFSYNVRKGAEKRSLEAIVSECEKFADLEEWSFGDTLPYSRAIENPVMYFYIGLYATQLHRWLRFYPPERMLVVKSEEFFSRTAETYQRVIRFLDLPAWRPARFRNYSYWGSRFKKERPEVEMPAAIRERLERMYQPHNERLTDMLGEDFRWSR